MGYIATPYEIVEHIKNERDHYKWLLFTFHDVMKNGRKSEVLKHFNSLSREQEHHIEHYESRLTGKNKTWGKKEFLNYLFEMIDEKEPVEEWREMWRKSLGVIE
tara:strand:- start:39 stop:350 length:312 start_codon:yes stop_codon:yes gene_type:complete